MAISQNQAQNFVNRAKNTYLRVMVHIESLQAVALVLTQEVVACGGVSAITAAIPDEVWETMYPFTKQEFGTIASAFGNLTDVLGQHDDLKADLSRLRE